MSRIAIIGCGVVGASIAYELSQVPGLSVTVFDRQLPAQGATGAALGILVGAISRKDKGRAWQLRLESMQRYETLIPELEAATDLYIPWNRQGILRLCADGEDLASWQNLANIRSSQGLSLEILTNDQVRSRYPYLNHSAIAAAIYSPQDRQVNPVTLTQALIAAARSKGVRFFFKTAVESFESRDVESRDVESKTLNLTPALIENQALSYSSPLKSAKRVCKLYTAAGAIAIDWLVIAAGLGSTALTTTLAQPIKIGPVLGQAMHLRLAQPLEASEHQPIITKDDAWLVPLGNSEYWVGSTVEFPTDSVTKDVPLQPDPTQFETLLQHAIAFCPDLKTATMVRQWWGLRPRPDGRPAPIIEPLPSYSNVLLATGHYRNGVLLAPATAQQIRQTIVSSTH